MHEVPVNWIRHAARQQGADSPVVRGALRAAGLSPRVLGDDSQRVPARCFADFIEQAARLAEDDTLGLNLGLSYDLRISGLAAYVSIVAATLREAMANATRYGAMNDTAADYGLTEAGNAASFRIESHSARFRASRHATEFKVGFIMAACRRWVGPNFRPLEVNFAHARASSLRTIAREVGCPVNFGAETTELMLGADQLELPVRSADPYLLALLLRHADETLAGRKAAEGTRGRVERLLLQRLPKGAPSLAEVADALGIGERTLARRLSSEGAPFRQVLEELRRDMARGYLGDPELSLAQIAYLLGYGDQSAFSNAFRRWTGHSPRRFRAAGAGA